MMLQAFKGKREYPYLVMVVHACQLHPAFVTAYFDQTLEAEKPNFSLIVQGRDKNTLRTGHIYNVTHSAEHDAKEEPAVCPDNDPGWWRAAGKLLPGHKGAEKNGQKASLQELRLPTFAQRKMHS